jgi:hypothetical protein
MPQSGRCLSRDWYEEDVDARLLAIGAFVRAARLTRCEQLGNQMAARHFMIMGRCPDTLQLAAQRSQIPRVARVNA